MPTIVEPICEVCLEPLQDDPHLNNLTEGLCKKCFLKRMDDYTSDLNDLELENEIDKLSQ